MTQENETAISLSRSIDGVLTKIESATLMVASASLFVIMIMIFFDAMSRYLLNQPLSFTYDIIVLYLMSATLISILSATLRHGGHISIDLFANLMNRRVYLVLIGISLLFGVFFCAIIAWQTTLLTYDSWHMGEIMTGVYAWPLWIGKAIVALSFIILTLRMTHLGLANLIAGLFAIPALEIKIMHDPINSEGDA